MKIANVDLTIYGALVMDDYNVGSANVSSNMNLSSTSTTPIGYGISIGSRSIEIPIAFKADTTLEAIKNKSKLAVSLCSGTIEIYDDENDFYYSAVFAGVANETILMPGVYTATFQFYGIMHGELITFIQGDSFTPQGFAENGEDCRLSVTVATLESNGTFKIGDITFKEDAVDVGTKIVIDGFDKRVLVNGAPGMHLCDLVSFPRLYTDRLNYIECKDPVTIEYYPVYK